MEGERLISFVIPVYNVPAEMLQACLQSILSLSLKEGEREIIVVDDGSTTRPLAELDEDLLDSMVYIRQRNGGVSAARNRGLRMATGRFVQFVDGDDMLIKPAYEHVLDLVRYGDADMVTFDFTHRQQVPLLYDDAGTMTGTEMMRRHNIQGSVWGYVFKRSILGNLRFTPGIAYGEDEEFTAQLLLRAESVHKTNAQAYFYRERSTSATGGKTIRQRLKRLNDSKSVLMRLNSMADRLPAADRAALRRRTAQLTMDYIYNVIVMTRNRHYLDRQLEQLRQAGLFPLPDRDYTTKYKWFRKMTNSTVGMSILMKTLPLLKRER